MSSLISHIPSILQFIILIGHDNPTQSISSAPVQEPSSLTPPDEQSEQAEEPLPWWHDWDVDSPPAPKTFHSFGQLPLELQIQIWSYAITPLLTSQSRLFSISSYATHAFQGQADNYRPLICTPPPTQYLSKAEKAELERAARAQFGKMGLTSGDREASVERLIIYAKPSRAAKWKSFFAMLWACKISRQIALLGWKQGVRERAEMYPPKEVYDQFTRVDLLTVLEACLERVTR